MLIRRNYFGPLSGAKHWQSSSLITLQIVIAAYQHVTRFKDNLDRELSKRLSGTQPHRPQRQAVLAACADSLLFKDTGDHLAAARAAIALEPIRR